MNFTADQLDLIQYAVEQTYLFDYGMGDDDESEGVPLDVLAARDVVRMIRGAL